MLLRKDNSKTLLGNNWHIHALNLSMALGVNDMYGAAHLPSSLRDGGLLTCASRVAGI
jgi:hypothetical protein